MSRKYKPRAEKDDDQKDEERQARQVNRLNLITDRFLKLLLKEKLRWLTRSRGGE